MRREDLPALGDAIDRARSLMNNIDNAKVILGLFGEGQAFAGPKGLQSIKFSGSDACPQLMTYAGRVFDDVYLSPEEIFLIKQMLVLRIERLETALASIKVKVNNG